MFDQNIFRYVIIYNKTTFLQLYNFQLAPKQQVNDGMYCIKSKSCTFELFIYKPKIAKNI